MRRLALFSAVLWLAACAVVPGEEKKEPAKVELTDAEKMLVELTNKERDKEKLPPLKVNPVLMKVARAHTENMAKTEMFEHVIDGKNDAARVKDAGYAAGVTGENIALGGKKSSPAEAVMDWMQSEGHRKNILNKEFKEIGVGIARSAKGETYYTQLFAAPR
jgi:uncharacterized protein YkwD